MSRFLSVAIEYFTHNPFIGSLAATVLIWGLAAFIRDTLKKRIDKKNIALNDKLALERQVLSEVFLPSPEQLDTVGGFQHLREFSILHEDEAEPKPEVASHEAVSGVGGLMFGYELQGKWNLYCADTFPMSIGCAHTKCKLCMPRETGLRDEHARVLQKDGKYVIQPVSGGEMSVNGKTVKAGVMLTDGMKIGLGSCVLLVKISRREEECA